MTNHLSGLEIKRRSANISYRALHEYLKHYCKFNLSRDEYKQLIADAGVRLRPQTRNPGRYMKFSQDSAKRILELWLRRLGATEMRKRGPRLPKPQ